jgi:cellulose biosynthesis protein BcsQ
MQCEYYALEGLSDLVNTIKKVHANLNRELKIIGLLRVMFDPRSTLSNQVSAQLEQHFGDKVFKHPGAEERAGSPRLRAMAYPACCSTRRPRGRRPTWPLPWK